MTRSLLVLVLLQQCTTFADDPEFVEDDDAALEEALAAAKRLENAEQDVMSDIEVRTSPPPPHPTRATSARCTHADPPPIRMPLTLCGTAACAHDLLGSDGGLVRVRADRLALQPREHHAAVRVGSTRL